MKKMRALYLGMAAMIVAVTALPQRAVAEKNHYILCRLGEKCALGTSTPLRYLATRIPQQPGNNTSADAISASGAIAANVTRRVDVYGDEEDVSALVFMPDNTLLRIAVPGSTARAYGINDKGAVVGSFEVNGQSRAFRFDGAVTTDISPPGASDSSARAINDEGDVAGIAAGHAFVVHQGKAIKFQEESYAFAINPFGQVAGFIRTSQSQDRAFYHAFRYVDGVLEDLGALGDDAYALGINASGDVVGETYMSDGLPRPFIYTEGVLRYVGAMHGSANAINAAGNVVGYQFDDGHFQVFLYADGTINALDDLTTGLDGARLVSANAINDAGQIAARACVPGYGGECFGVRLDPLN